MLQCGLNFSPSCYNWTPLVRVGRGGFEPPLSRVSAVFLCRWNTDPKCAMGGSIVELLTNSPVAGSVRTSTGILPSSARSRIRTLEGIAVWFTARSRCPLG